MSSMTILLYSSLSSFAVFVLIIALAKFRVWLWNHRQVARKRAIDSVSLEWDSPNIGISSSHRVFLFSDCFLHVLDFSKVKFSLSIKLRDIKAFVLYPLDKGQISLWFELHNGDRSPDLCTRDVNVFVSIFKLMRQHDKDIVFSPIPFPESSL